MGKQMQQGRPDPDLWRKATKTQKSNQIAGNCDFAMFGEIALVFLQESIHIW